MPALISASHSLFRFSIQSTRVLTLILLMAAVRLANAEINPTLDSQDSEKMSDKVQRVEWQAWTDDVFEQAKKESKLVLVDVSAVWCGYCKKMDETTYQDPEIVQYIRQHFIPVRVKDGDTVTPIVDRFKEYATPTTAVFDANDHQLVVKTGYLKPQWMSWMLQAVVADPTPEDH